MLHIYVDADACPVKNEVYKVAGRYGLPVTLVANSFMRVPGGDVKLVVVDQGRDEADDWIAGAVEPGDIVITGDIPLAAHLHRASARGAGRAGERGGRRAGGSSCRRWRR